MYCCLRSRYCFRPQFARRSVIFPPVLTARSKRDCRQCHSDTTGRLFVFSLKIIAVAFLSWEMVKIFLCAADHKARAEGRNELPGVAFELELLDSIRQLM